MNSLVDMGLKMKLFGGFLLVLSVALAIGVTGYFSLDSSSGNLSGLSEKMTAGARDTSEKSDSVAAASEEMSANISSVAAAMAQTATVAEEITDVNQAAGGIRGQRPGRATRSLGPKMAIVYFVC